MLAASATALLAILVTAIVPAEASETSTPAAPVSLPAAPVGLGACPWLAALMKRRLPPSELARTVVSRMTLKEKLGELVLRSSGPYENVNAGVPRLCIPSLTLQDGPGGLAYGDKGVTQPPAPLGLAASFDPELARQYGQLLGQEAHGQGIDVVQAPTINIDRVPQSGQGFTGFGEDPLIVSTMAAGEIRGIQSTGVMADAKHLTVYSQETDRLTLDDSVSTRALQEVYLAPFRSAVGAGVASMMCAYPRLNGTLQCQDPLLEWTLSQWGFTGFVRSDEGAVHDPAAALTSGIDLLKPGSVSALAAAVAKGSLRVPTVDRDVEQVLTQMFAYGLIGRPRTGGPGTPVDSPAHAQAALNMAERSIVLLRNRNHNLPIDLSTVGSVAVIGAAASDAPVIGGHGSSQVIAPFVSKPLVALKAGLGPRVAVSYVDGGSTTRALPPIPSVDLTPVSGRGHGLTVTVTRQSGARVTTTEMPASAGASLTWAPPTPTPASPSRTAGLAEASRRLTPTRRPAGGPSRLTVSLTGSLTVPRSGLYALSITESGPATLSLGGSVVVDEWTNQGFGTWSGTVYLAAAHRYAMRLDWAPLHNGPGTRNRVVVGMADASPAISAAARAARSARVAVVFAADYSGETFDRPSLSLPGDQNALITAVAAANPRTVVVLDTSGPVLMPWLDRVASVLEAWYPGEQDGAAIASVLLGRFDPSGHLPVTFPSGAADSPTPTSPQPGNDLVSSYPDGLDVGYRHYSQTGIKPLFPFGFGLSYTSFAVSNLSVSAHPTAVNVSLRVANTGRRPGGDVVQAYLNFPPAAGEPPNKLVAFKSVSLPAGRSANLTMTIPWSRFQIYGASGWTVVPGRYSLGVGDSSSLQPLHAYLRIPARG
jgi:beta-glucosidase